MKTHGMKTIKDLTPEIQAKIPEYIKKYTEGIYDGGRYNSFERTNAEKLIFWNYEKCGYKKPVVLVAGNPYEAQLIFNWIVANKMHYIPILGIIYYLQNGMKIPIEANTLRNPLANTLGNTLDSTLYNTLRNPLANTLRNPLANTLGNTLVSTLANTLDSTLYNTLVSTLRNPLANTLLYNTLDSTLHSTLYNTLRNPLANTLGNTLDSTLHSTLVSTLANTLDSTLYNTLYNTLVSTLANTLDNTLYNTLASTLANKNPDYIFTANIWSNGLLAWWKFAIDEFKLDCSVKIDLNSWNDLYLKSGVYSAIFSKLLCVVSKYPKKIYRNGRGRLHNPIGVSIEWEYVCEQTNFENYFWNGVEVPKEWILEKEQIGKSVITNVKNAEKRRCLREIIGAAKYYELLGGVTLVDEDIDNQGNSMRLLETTEKDEITDQHIQFLEVVCPSTGRLYNLYPINQKSKNVWEAKASTFQKKEKEFHPFVES